MPDLEIPNVKMSDTERAAMNAQIDDMDKDGEAVAVVDETAPAAVVEKPIAEEINKEAVVDEKTKPVMIPKPRLDEELAKNEDLRRRLSALEARDKARFEPLPDRDFAAERKAIYKQYTDGDLELDERDEKLAELGALQSEHIATNRFVELQKSQQVIAAKDSWDSKALAWETKHADFLSNDIRKDAVQALITKLSPSGLGDDELLAEVERQAFEAFGYKTAAKEPEPVVPVNPHAARNAADAKAIASASNTPSPLTGGTGDRSLDVGVDLNTMKLGDFKKLSKEQQAKMLGEDA